MPTAMEELPPALRARKKRRTAQVLMVAETLLPEGSIKVELYLIDVTPAPILARFDRPHDRMRGRMEVFRRMLVLRRITASDVPATHAKPEMNPRVAHLQTLFTTARVRLYLLNLVQMSALHNLFIVCGIKMSVRCGIRSPHRNKAQRPGPA